MMKFNEHSRKGQEGATLMELVVSITVIGITFAGLAFQWSSAMEKSHWSLETTQGLFIARARQEAALSKYRLAPVGSKGSAVQSSTEAPVPGYPLYNRTTTVTHTGGAECPDCINIDIVVTHANSGRTLFRLNESL